MRLLRLKVVDLAAIRLADVEFGPGLNVLYGPNDLGKSTLADAIRLALLLPHSSTHGEPYTPWTGGQDPVVELTFEIEAQRIWRVKKKFSKGGSSVLSESKNGVDFDEVERARKVDAKLRDILRWGIPEPGGAGGSKGLPTSFLATALLSTQANVTAVLHDSLQEDPSGSGKERIAAALQAVAQDPLFLSLLSDTQARRDEAYTDKGAKKKAKGSVFQAAADKLNQARDAKEELQKVVYESEGVEKQLRDLTSTRAQREVAVAAATDRLVTLERLSAQAATLAAAVDLVRLGREEVARIQETRTDVQLAERSAGDLARKVEDAKQALKVAQGRQAGAEAALETAEEAAREAGPDPALTNTVARQSLDLRKAAADRASTEAQQRIEGATAAQKYVDAAAAAERELRAHETSTGSARAHLDDVVVREQAAEDQLRRVDLLERAVDARSADERVAAAKTDVDKEAAVRARLESELGARSALADRRATMTVPSPAQIVPMRRLAAELAAARGALDVGLVVTVTPRGPVELRVRKDGTAADSTSIDAPLEIEAVAEVDIDIADVATVRVRGGRREAQKTAESLEHRWSEEVAPHLATAGAADLEALDAKVAEALELDASIKTKDAELESLRHQMASLAGSADAFREASDRAKGSHAALGDVALETLTSDLAALGPDPAAALRKRRQQWSKDLETARAAANQAGTAQALAEERIRNTRSALDAAIVARDTALASFPDGVATTLASAQAALAAASGEQEKVRVEFASLESTIAAEAARIEGAVRDAQAAADKARIAVEAAQGELTKAMTDHASQVGRLEELRRLRDREDLATAETWLLEATQRQAALPVPARVVTEEDVSAARDAVTRSKADLEGINGEIQRAHGALQQVGGAVARERLRDAIEAFEQAERHEREIEADCEAWKLLLEQMKEADAAQASNLGNALAPAIASRFESLTQRRYESVRLTAQLATEGVVVGGAVRSTERMSVGTREQLSTLYRLSLAEYLQTTVVLDDQLVQSDESRMDWFRALLEEKARSFQIIVFTCRPGDYLEASAMVPEGKVVHADTNGVHAVDLGRAVQRR